MNSNIDFAEEENRLNEEDHIMEAAVMAAIGAATSTQTWVDCCGCAWYDGILCH
jgi:hypothetical protein